MSEEFRIGRRALLRAATGACTAALLGRSALASSHAHPGRELTVRARVLEVRGRAATVFGILDDAGRSGLTLRQSEGFRVRLRNDTGEPTVIHWHGLTPPFALDGTLQSQRRIEPAEAADYGFELARPGTNWMHSHLGLQEQMLMAAPLIVRADADEARDRQEVVMLLHDFSFSPPAEILARLVSGAGGHAGSGTAGMDHAAMPGMNHGGMAMDAGRPPMDLNDVAFDAYLANDRDLSDPEVVPVERGGRVLLRIINAASSTNFWVDLGPATGTLVAVDGRTVRPVRGSRFEIAIAQRLDIELSLPAGAGALPILAQREGDRARTGIVLAGPGAPVARLAAEADAVAPPVLLDLERRLAATEPLAARPADRSIVARLTGSMQDYAWGIDGRGFEARAPLDVGLGERVEITLANDTMMAHPMHLHGHHFQVVALGASRLAGAMRDTVMVPAMQRVTIAFDADNPGDWPFHCHNLYHMAAGMMTTLRYV